MTRWMRSSRCSNGNCVAVARDGDTVLVRDSKDPDGPTLRFTRGEWRAFVAAARDGEFDLPVSFGERRRHEKVSSRG